uniref:Uncharacterized protein n=1 Tax=Anguilla anguilla TaxID=7936 RepID=A0A0E9V8N3_ANGAN
MMIYAAHCSTIFISILWIQFCVTSKR